MSLVALKRPAAQRGLSALRGSTASARPLLLPAAEARARCWRCHRHRQPRVPATAGGVRGGVGQRAQTGAQRQRECGFAEQALGWWASASPQKMRPLRSDPIAVRTRRLHSGTCGREGARRDDSLLARRWRQNRRRTCAALDETHTPLIFCLCRTARPAAAGATHRAFIRLDLTHAILRSPPNRPTSALEARALCVSPHAPAMSSA